MPTSRQDQDYTCSVRDTRSAGDVVLEVSDSKAPRAPSMTRAIPVTLPQLPNHMSLTVRVSRIAALGYQHSNAEAEDTLPAKDSVVTMGKVSTSGVEALLEIDISQGQVSSDAGFAFGKVMSWEFSGMQVPMCLRIHHFSAVPLRYGTVSLAKKYLQKVKHQQGEAEFCTCLGTMFSICYEMKLPLGITS